MERGLPINCAARNSVWTYPRVVVSRFPGAPALVETTRSHEMPAIASLPEGANVEVELWGGSVKFWLDGEHLRVYLGKFHYVAFQSESEARGGLVSLWKRVRRLESVKEVEQTAEAWFEARPSD